MTVYIVQKHNPDIVTGYKNVVSINKRKSTITLGIKTEDTVVYQVITDAVTVESN